MKKKFKQSDEQIFVIMNFFTPPDLGSWVHHWQKLYCFGPLHSIFAVFGPHWFVPRIVEGWCYSFFVYSYCGWCYFSDTSFPLHWWGLANVGPEKSGVIIVLEVLMGCWWVVFWRLVLTFMLLETRITLFGNLVFL